MVHEESEGMPFKVSQLEQNFKGMVKTLDLCNLEERMENNMGSMEKRMEKKLE